MIRLPTLCHLYLLNGVGDTPFDRGVRYAIPPMSAEEIASCVAHHLQIGGRSDTLFSNDALTKIHQARRGLPRAVNNLARQVLLAA